VVEPKSHEALKGEAKWGGGGDDVKPAYYTALSYECMRP
jgi:hypothetical protein